MGGLSFPVPLNPIHKRYDGLNHNVGQVFAKIPQISGQGS